MKRHRKTSKESLCESWGSDDGIPPRELARRENRQHKEKQRNRFDHRALQYCKQAHVALESALSCDLGDPTLRRLTLLSVSPLRGCSTIEVTWSSPDRCLTAIKETELRLRAAEGLLRAAIAAMTHRKHVAHLRFRVVPAAEEGD